MLLPYKQIMINFTKSLNRAILILTAFLLFGWGSETNPKIRGNSAVMPNSMAIRSSESLRAPATYVIQSGDILRVRMLDEDDFDVRTRVTKEGTINLPYIDTVSVAGKTITQITEQIQKKLSRFYVNPLLNLEVEEYSKRFFVVLGQVERPGMYELPPLQDSIDLMEAIAIAGGATRVGDLAKVVIKRIVDGREKVITVDSRAKSISRNERGGGISVLSGDTIVIQTARREFVVLGSVRAPGLFQLPPMMDEITLLEAIGMAGGLSRGGDIGDVTIKRTIDGREQVIRYETKSLGKNKDTARQVLVQSGDVITVQMLRSDFSILGQVRNPGIFAIPDGEESISILEALAMAGGINRLGDLSDVKVYRKIGAREVMMNLNVGSMGKSEKNKVFFVQAGDKVIVGERIF